MHDAGERFILQIPYLKKILRKVKNMQKKTPDYDNVFKTMKSKHKRLFISVSVGVSEL